MPLPELEPPPLEPVLPDEPDDPDVEPPEELLEGPPELDEDDPEPLPPRSVKLPSLPVVPVSAALASAPVGATSPEDVLPQRVSATLRARRAMTFRVSMRGARRSHASAMRAAGRRLARVAALGGLTATERPMVQWLEAGSESPSVHSTRAPARITDGRAETGWVSRDEVRAAFSE
jgi:hypothetical protein